MNNRIKRWWVSILSVAMVLMSLTPPLMAAQEPLGAIEGTVKDPQGAVVAGAVVTIRQTSTNTTRTVTANDNGYYRVGQLQPGTYTVRVTAENFKASVVSEVKVAVGANVPLDVQLEVGVTSEQVTISGGGEAVIDRTDNEVSGVVGTLQIENLPLNGRNFLDLARLQPGAETVDGGGFDPTKANYTGVSIAGQAGRSTQITVDGGSVVDNVVGTTVQNFSQEIIQEFQVGISNYDLSTGASASGSVNVVSKSGTNEYHGNGYMYWRDSSFAAFPSLNRLDAVHGIPTEAQVAEIPFDREQFGGTIGGPIKKDKLFFFGNVEFNNQDSIALHVLPSTIPGFSGFTGSPFNELLVTGKLDWQVNNNARFFGRYSHDDNDQQQPFGPGTGIVPRDSGSGIFQTHDQINTNRSDGFVIGFTNSLGSNKVNDVRYNFNDFHNRIDPATPDFPAIWVINPDQTWRSGTNYITPQVTDQNRSQIRDDFTWTVGTHTIRFGGDWERTSLSGLFDFAKPARIRLFGPVFTGQTLETEADFLNAPVRDISMGIGSGELPFNTPGNETVNHRLQFYGTDTWKITPNFTLNYGLAYRWDSNLWNSDQGRPAVIAPLLSGGTAPAARDNNNLAPRLGFAWDVRGDSRTVIRGGFGMYYDTTIDNLRLFERADLGPAGAELFLVGSDIQSNLLPGGDARFGTAPGATGFLTLGQALGLISAVRADVESRAFNCTLPTSIECFQAVSGPIFSSNFQVPYSLQYSAGIQKVLPGSLILQADFNYRKGVHEVLVYDANFFDSVDSQGNPTPVSNFPSGVPYADSSAFSTYKALLLRVDRRFEKGFQFTASYTFSRFKAFGGDVLGLGATITDRNDFSKEFGPAGLDRNHRFVFSAVWDLPFFNDATGAKRAVLGGWTLSLISTAFSGIPFSAILPDFVDLTGSGSFTSYLPGVGAGEVGRKFSSLGKLNEAIRNYNANRSQFAARIEGGVPVDPYGTPLRELAELPAGSFIGGDSLIAQDLRVTKGFRLTESKKIDFIVEVFNLFNVANLTSVVDTTIPALEDTQQPGYEFTAFRPTQRNSNIFGTGGPRAFQFAAKFTF